MYHIFQVFDYKGGELASVVNLTREELIINLCDSYYIENEIKSIEDLKVIIQNRSDIYAGGDAVVIEIYKSNNKGELENVSIDVFVDEMYKYLKEE